MIPGSQLPIPTCTPPLPWMRSSKAPSRASNSLLNIVAMLIVLVALVYLANAILGLLPMSGGAGISLQRMLGYAMAPVCWLMGLPWPQAITAGSLMGVKTVLNELIAYVDYQSLVPMHSIRARG